MGTRTFSVRFCATSPRIITQADPRTRLRQAKTVGCFPNIEQESPELSFMCKLRYATSDDWIEAVMNDFDAFLIDHAAAEKKASGMAVSMLSHYPDRHELVKAMIDLSIEEMTHFREVVKIMQERGLILGADKKDQYVLSLRNLHRKGSEVYFLDRLLIAGIIEARGCERFGLVAKALPEGKMKNFYVAITESESRHENLFIELAGIYFPRQQLDERLDTLLDEEARICSELPIISALH